VGPTESSPPSTPPQTSVEPASQPPPPTEGTAASLEPTRVVPVNRGLRAVSFVMMGAGVAGLAAGTYFGVRTLEDKNSRDAICHGQLCGGQGVALDGQARSFATSSTAWFAGGLVAGGVGVGLFLMSRSRVVSQGSAALHVVVDVGADRASAGLGGSF
jgi:hypothetical protein